LAVLRKLDAHPTVRIHIFERIVDEDHQHLRDFILALLHENIRLNQGFHLDSMSLYREDFLHHMAQIKGGFLPLHHAVQLGQIQQIRRQIGHPVRRKGHVLHPLHLVPRDWPKAHLNCF